MHKCGATESVHDCSSVKHLTAVHLCLSACIPEPWATYSKQLTGREFSPVSGLQGVVSIPPVGGGGGGSLGNSLPGMGGNRRPSGGWAWGREGAFAVSSSRDLWHRMYVHAFAGPGEVCGHASMWSAYEGVGSSFWSRSREGERCLLSGLAKWPLQHTNHGALCRYWVRARGSPAL